MIFWPYIEMASKLRYHKNQNEILMNPYLAHVAPKPTQRGVIAFTLSAFASKASASAAHCIAFAI